MSESKQIVATLKQADARLVWVDADHVSGKALRDWIALAERFAGSRRPPPHIRPKLDIGYRIAGQSVELFEVRPRRDKPSEKMQHPFAKATYVKTTGTWKVFWRRADLKWHGYEPAPHFGSIEKFLEIVDEDKHACFFG